MKSLVTFLFLTLISGCAANPAEPSPTESLAAAVTETPSPILAPTQAIKNITETTAASPLPKKMETTLTPPPAAETPNSKASEPATVVPGAATPTQKASGDVTPDQAQSGSCPTDVPSRLAVGQTARVLRRLNLRSDASIDAPILQTSPIDSQVEIIGGPICIPIGALAYQWWQIRLANGMEGWSVESPLKGAIYYLEPIP